VCALNRISQLFLAHHLASKLGASKQKNPKNCQKILSVLPLNPKPCTDDAFQAKQKSTQETLFGPLRAG